MIVCQKRNGMLSILIPGMKWNFTKFLIDREGNIVKRFEPTDIDNISDEIKKYI